jgi:hypothetical protein
MTNYQVNYRDPDTETETPFGRLAYGDRGVLTFISAISSHEAFLRGLVEQLNRLQRLSVRTDPSPDAPRYTLATRQVPRDSEDFLDALKSYLQRFFDLTLTMEEGLPPPPEERP